MSKNIEKVCVTYDEIFCDEISVEVLCRNKGNINGYESSNGEVLTKKEVIEWIVENYYNRRGYVEWYNSSRIHYPMDEKKLYLYDANYKELVDMERLYMLYLMETEITKIAEIFDISRPTVYKRIKIYEEKFLRG